MSDETYIEFSAFGDNFRFGTREEFLRWLEGQRDRWHSLGRRMKDTQPANQYCMQVVEKINHLINDVRSPGAEGERFRGPSGQLFGNGNRTSLTRLVSGLHRPG